MRPLGGSANKTGILIRREIRTQTQRRTCEDTGGKENHQEARGASAEINLDNTLDFQTPELWENKFLSFKPPSPVVLCHGSPRKLIHWSIQYHESIFVYCFVHGKHSIMVRIATLIITATELLHARCIKHCGDGSHITAAAAARHLMSPCCSVTALSTLHVVTNLTYTTILGERWLFPVPFHRWGK